MLRGKGKCLFNTSNVRLPKPNKEVPQTIPNIILSFLYSFAIFVLISKFRNKVLVKVQYLEWRCLKHNKTGNVLVSLGRVRFTIVGWKSAKYRVFWV